MCYMLIAFRGRQLGFSMQKRAIEFQDRLDNLSELIALFSLCFAQPIYGIILSTWIWLLPVKMDFIMKGPLL